MADNNRLSKPGLIPVKVENQGSLITTQVNKINFSGSGVTASVGQFNDLNVTIGGGASFPYTGSAQITGSLGVTGSSGFSGSITQIGNTLISGSLTISGSSSGKSIFKRVKDFLNKKEKEKETKPKITISEFFKSLKSSAINLEEYSARSNDYINAYKYAKQLNQAALVSELKSKIDQAKYENILFASGFRTVITEEQVVKFYKESPKGLEMTWIRNFIRVIPEKAADKKKEADKLNVFDNYVLLHYDPEKKSFKEEDKDPILFGVISGIRKLYYIADWVDEYCDLTLDQFIEKFGNEAITANDISVNFKL